MKIIGPLACLTSSAPLPNVATWRISLLLWALSASALTWFALRELTAASRRFDDFVRELARFNELFGGH
jgi:hypothetical protein